jgi:ATP-dependent helicase Lhr and Lhr-like helicase
VPKLVKGLVAELPDRQLWQGKYDYLTPRTLLEKAYINDVLDVSGTMQWLATCS